MPKPNEKALSPGTKISRTRRFIHLLNIPIRDKKALLDGISPETINSIAVRVQKMIDNQVELSREAVSK